MLRANSPSARHVLASPARLPTWRAGGSSPKGHTAHALARFLAAGDPGPCCQGPALPGRWRGSARGGAEARGCGTAGTQGCVRTPPTPARSERLVRGGIQERRRTREEREGERKERGQRGGEKRRRRRTGTEAALRTP